VVVQSESGVREVPGRIALSVHCDGERKAVFSVPRKGTARAAEALLEGMLEVAAALDTVPEEERYAAFVSAAYGLLRQPRQAWAGEDFAVRARLALWFAASSPEWPRVLADMPWHIELHLRGEGTRLDVKLRGHARAAGTA